MLLYVLLSLDKRPEALLEIFVAFRLLQASRIFTAFLKSLVCFLLVRYVSSAGVWQGPRLSLGFWEGQRSFGVVVWPELKFS